MTVNMPTVVSSIIVPFFWNIIILAITVVMIRLLYIFRWSIPITYFYPTIFLTVLIEALNMTWFLVKTMKIIVPKNTSPGRGFFTIKPRFVFFIGLSSSITRFFIGLFPAIGTGIFFNRLSPSISRLFIGLFPAIGTGTIFMVTSTM